MSRRLWIIVSLLLLSSGCAEHPDRSQTASTQTSLDNSIRQTEDSEPTPSVENSQPRDERLIEPISIDPISTPEEQTQVAQTSPSAQFGNQPRSPRRPADHRPTHNDARLAEFGIHRYESNRLRLYTDIDPDIAVALPTLIDQLYPVWVDYFGELPEAEDGSEFQLTGYLMSEADPYIAAGLLPAEFRTLQHGQHRGLEFWMYDQPTDYYRRHLLIHEATHCFMTIVPSRQLQPLWYLEGMAELLGVHEFDDDGSATYSLMPRSSESVSGFGRVELIQQMIAEGRGLTVAGVNKLGVPEFSESRSEPYAWSWAFCRFLDSHPRYRGRFRELCYLRDGIDFVQGLDAAYHDDMSILWIEWELFISQIEYGHQIDRSAIDFQGGVPLAPGESVTLDIAADRGWQPSGVRVEAGRTYRISATGEITLADEPVPWVSTPRGVSIRYAHGRPIGKLLAGVISEQPPGDIGTCGLLHPIEVNEAVEFTPSEAGTLYLRINDYWSELDDNRGGYEAIIQSL